MFRVIRCIKCGHVMAGEDTFVQNLMERYNLNTKKIKNARGSYLQALIQENSMLRSYLRQILHWQHEMNYHQDIAQYKLRALLEYVKAKKIMQEDDITKILNRAEELQKQRLMQDAEKLKELYGDFESFCANRTKSDPTASAAIGSAMKGGKNNG
ncbi:MAG: hypothetical protein MJ170_02825 [Alphaproteobacteria bacterium]|nr:hypothetical protein [Alphaproteobacteria bacterium]